MTDKIGCPKQTPLWLTLYSISPPPQKKNKDNDYMYATVTGSHKFIA